MKDGWEKVPKLFIAYVSGRWGPECILGYFIAKNADCFHESTYITWDIVGKVKDDLKLQITEYETSPKAVRITNPLSITNTQDFRKWQRKQARLRDIQP